VRRLVRDKKSAAIAFEFSFVTALEEFCSPVHQLENVFQRTAILGSASVTKQLD
jgi:hypothetical protein